MSIQGSAMMYVTGPSLRDELVHELRCARPAPSEPRSDRGPPPAPRGGPPFGVIREPEDGNVRVRLVHLVGSTRATSTMTRSAGRCSPSSSAGGSRRGARRAFLERTGRPQLSRIVATAGNVPPRNRSLEGLRGCADARRPAPHRCAGRGGSSGISARGHGGASASSLSSMSRDVLRHAERLPAMGGPLGHGSSKAACSRAPGTVGSTTSGRARTSSTARKPKPSRPSSRTARSRSSFETDAELERGLD